VRRWEVAENKEKTTDFVDTNSPAQLVQVNPPERGVVRAAGWSWSKTKRKAVQLVLRGVSSVDMAKTLGVHRNTIRAWRARPEFQAEVMARAHDYANETRFRRVYETGTLASQMASRAAQVLADIDKQEGELSQGQLNRLQLFLREYREFRREERQDFGDNTHRVEGNFLVNVTGAAIKQTSGDSFREFLAQNADKVPERLIHSAKDPTDAIVNVTRTLIRQTDILDQLHAEDESALRKDAQESGLE